MKSKKIVIPEISDFVESVMPKASYEDKLEATQNFRELLGVVHGICIRLEEEEIGENNKN